MSDKAESPNPEASSDPAVREDRIESSPVDLGGQHGGIGAEGRTPYPSEMLYIVREANIVEEFDEVLATKGVDLKGGA